MIHLEHVSKQFEHGGETFFAVDEVSFHIERGACVVLKGASGSGKSTLLSMIAGLLQPTSGSIMVNDKEIASLPEQLSAPFRLENIGFIFQKFHLIAQMSMEENIMVPLIPLGLSRGVVEQRVEEKMREFHLLSKAKRRVELLSGGEQQRVAIARALIANPRIILADEPTANLDEQLSHELLHTLSHLKESGLTMLIATHDPLVVEAPFVDSIIELRHGKVV